MKKHLALILVCILFFAVNASADNNEIVAQLRQGKLKLSLDDLFALISSNPDCVVIDSRGPKAYARGHIPTAINIPGWEIETNLYKIPDTESMIVCYCDGSGCSVSYLLADTLKKKGYTQVAVYDGGVRDWESINFPLVSTDLENWPKISGPDLKLLSDSGAPAFIIDTRAGGYFFSGSIKGAKSAPLSTINEDLPILPKDKSRMIVLFGLNRIDSTPYAAAKILSGLGYTNILIYGPGVSGWKAEK